MLYNKDNLYIDTRYGTVFKYLFICPAICEVIVEVVIGKASSVYNYFDRYYIEREHYYRCNFYCKCYRECKLLHTINPFDKEVFNRLLSDKKIVHYNKLNSVLYLKDNVRKYIEKWLQK